MKKHLPFMLLFSFLNYTPLAFFSSFGIVGGSDLAFNVFTNWSFFYGLWFFLNMVWFVFFSNILDAIMGCHPLMIHVPLYCDNIFSSLMYKIFVLIFHTLYSISLYLIIIFFFKKVKCFKIKYFRD